MSEEALNVRVPTELKRELERRAEQNDRSLSGEVRRALGRYVEPVSVMDAETPSGSIR
jgi:predicted transcriptional regulator